VRFTRRAIFSLFRSTNADWDVAAKASLQSLFKLDQCIYSKLFSTQEHETETKRWLTAQPCIVIYLDVVSKT
jgi:hypothetical protein